MEGKTVLITGANSGIGKATATGIAEMSANVVMLCRDKEKGEEARREIIRKTGNGSVDLIITDLADLATVRSSAKKILGRHPKIDVLINNAGGYFGSRRTTKDGFEYTFGMNHLGHFLLTNLLMEGLRNSNDARIINVSSEAQRQGHIEFEDLMQEKRKYSGIRAYSQAKLANILFSKELSKRLEGTGITANAVHPGTVRTNFGSESSGFFRFVISVLKPFMRSPEKGADTSIYLASSSEVSGVTGKYFYDRKEKHPIPEATDEDVSRRLWEVSAKLTGM